MAPKEHVCGHTCILTCRRRRTRACRVLPHSLASHAYGCCKIGSSGRHAHQRNPTALYHVGLPYASNSPGGVSAFTAADKQSADDIPLPHCASSLSGPHVALWQAALDKEHTAFDRLAVCDLLRVPLLPRGIASCA